MKKTIKKERKKLTLAILSLSLLTVMAGAAVAPALGVIKAHFNDVNPLFVQMIISIPALFIVITNIIFPKLCNKIKSRSLLMIGLLFYTIGGCIAGLFNNIFLVLAARALVGIGVGIVMPMSTGLLAFYYGRDQQDELMGYSSAMNQMGGAIATLLSGLLATFSWRASFLVYLMGLISIILCIKYLPNEKIGSEKTSDRSGGIFAKNYPFIVAMFILMFTFFIYPANFAIETTKDAIIPSHLIAVIMACMDLIAFVGGLSFIYVKRCAGKSTRVIAPLMFLAGYIFLNFMPGWAGTIIGSCFIGFANGMGIPFIIAAASQKTGRTAATTVIPLISAALYLSQFLTPIILSIVNMIFTDVNITHLPYAVGIASAAILTIWSLTIRTDETLAK